MNALIEEIKTSIAIDPASGVAGTTNINGAVLDMQGFDGALILVQMGAIDASAVTSIKAQQGDASDLSDASDLEGTKQDIADSDDNKLFYIDLVKPSKRYVRVVVNRGTANATIASATYIQYKARNLATSQGSNVSGETHVSPAEGTA